MKVFTTGQVAKICKVAPSTVSKWFDSGRLKGYRIPGSQDRRIPSKCLIGFLRKYADVFGAVSEEALSKLLCDTTANVLIVAHDQFMVEGIITNLRTGIFRVAVATSGFDAGIQAESFHPDCVVVDFSIGHTEALQICQNLRRNAEFAEVILIALLPQAPAPAILQCGIREFFVKPFCIELLAERLRTLISAKKELV